MAEWYVFAIASALTSGLVPSVNKAILGYDENALEFSAVLSLVNAVFTLPLLIFVSLNAVPAKTILLLFAGSALGTMGFLYISKSVRILPVSVVSPLTNFNPAVLAVLAFLVLGERLAAQQLFGIVLVMSGAYFLERITSDKMGICNTGSATKWAFVLAITSAVFYGFSSVIDKVVLSVMSPLQYVLLAHVFIAFNFAILSNASFIFSRSGAAPYLRFFGSPRGLLGRKKSLFIASSILTITYRLLQANAVSLANVSLVIPIRHLGSLASIAVGGRLFREGRLPEKMAIGLMMLAGTYFIVL